MSLPHDLNFAGSRIVNRSQRVWLFGFVRLLPGIAVFGPLLVLLVVAMILGPNMAMGPTLSATIAVTYMVVLISAIIVERSSLLDPVDIVWLSETLIVKRLVGRPKFVPIRDITRLEIQVSAARDYGDDLEQATATPIVFRLRWRYKAALLIAAPAVPVVIAWAKRQQIPIHDERYPSPGENPDA